MVSPQLSINQDYLFKKVRPTAGNPPTKYNCQALSGLRKHGHPARGPSDAAPQQYERPKVIITWEMQKPTTNDEKE